MLTNVSSNIFSNSSSIYLRPTVFAEWNQNIYNPPYLTLSGTGVKQTNITTTATLTNVTGSSAKPGFITKQFVMSADQNLISYSITPLSSSPSFKIISYIKTNKDYPIMANIYGEGAFGQYGSTNAEISSLGWTKIELFVGGASSLDNISSFTYNIILNRFNDDDVLPANIIFTEPEVYPISFFDYKYNSIYPTDSPFANFRPGESYVNTGSSLFSFPTNFRKYLTSQGSDACVPVSSISRAPTFFPVSSPTKYYKNALVSDMAQYKYFISDVNNRSITAIYSESGVVTNKLVIKLNTLISIPTINIAINGTNIIVDGSVNINLSKNVSKENGGLIEEAGVLVLYWTGSAWTRSRWSTMPTISTTSGQITTYTTINKITITEQSYTLREGFTDMRARMLSQSLNLSYFDNDASRLQVIEISPRVEVDLTPFTINMSINKSMDSKSTALPISSINSNDASVVFSSIPAGNSTLPIPIFSNQSNYSGSVLKNMLNKNVKFYLNYYLERHNDNRFTTNTNSLIPGGIFYSDVWSENDANQVSVQCFDITRYLQSAQIADYVSNEQSALNVISGMLDLSGFTDYDDSLLQAVCESKKVPMDLAYFYVNSKDTTIIDAINQIFLPYQIVAYVDEYGLMKFSSLADMLNSSAEDIIIDQSNILDNGYSVTNKAKPGKISLRYNLPRIKQSAAMQNLALDEKTPSFIYTTSNEVVWSQQNSDSVGMNYLKNGMDATQNFFEMDSSDLLDIFHTYNLNFQGYAAIENEIVSFVYKEYKLISDTIRPENEPLTDVLVSVKDNLELNSEISRFNKEYQVTLKAGTPAERPISPTIVTPTGKITKVQRGMFGSKAYDHTVLSAHNAATKHMTCKILSNTNHSITGDGTFDTTNNNEFLIQTPMSSKVLLYPTTERNNVNSETGLDYYKTYSTKIRLTNSADKSSGGLFFNLDPDATTKNNAYFLELVRYNTLKDDMITPNDPRKFKYLLVFYTITSGVADIISYTDVTTVVKNILRNTEKVLEEVQVDGKTRYVVKNDPRYQYFNLKAVTYKSTGNLTGIGPNGTYTYNDGESTTATNLLSVFLNNNEIKGWRKFAITSYDGPIAVGSWVPMDRNLVTNLPKKIQYTNSIIPGSIFGSFISADPVQVTGINYISNTSVSHSGSIRELYATHKPLKEKSVNYYFQTREFLNGLIQNQNLFSLSKSYMMQTKPEVIGINVYDVQYTTPAAISVDVWPVAYKLKYFPGPGPAKQKFMQTKHVNEYALSYSSIINTGFRAKFAIANSSSHMVYLMKEPDQSKQATARLNLWTHEIITNSDPEIIEQVIDSGNFSESIQLDSNWIQSKESAIKLLSVISNGIDYFSKDISLDIFGNPLLQIGDKVKLTYPLAGINQQLYIITSISHDFDNGLGTKIGLNMINPGVSY